MASKNSKTRRARDAKRDRAKGIDRAQIKKMVEEKLQ